MNLKKTELYDKYRDGVLDREGFIREKERYTDETIRVKKEIEQEQRELAELQELHSQIEYHQAEEKRIDNLLNLPEDKVKEMMYHFVEKVEVYDSTNVKVIWNFSDGLKNVA